eukprot:g4885.t1
MTYLEYTKIPELGDPCPECGQAALVAGETEYAKFMECPSCKAVPRLLPSHGSKEDIYYPQLWPRPPPGVF